MGKYQVFQHLSMQGKITYPIIEAESKAEAKKIAVAMQDQQEIQWEKPVNSRIQAVVHPTPQQRLEIEVEYMAEQTADFWIERGLDEHLTINPLNNDFVGANIMGTTGGPTIYYSTQTGTVIGTHGRLRAEYAVDSKVADSLLSYYELEWKLKIEEIRNN